MQNYLDICFGLERLENNKKNYIEILKSYAKESVEAKKILNESLKNKDYDRYRIQIHALKSISLSIGAKELSEFAQRLEYSVKDGRYEFVDENNDDFLKKYDSILEQIKNYLLNETAENEIKEVYDNYKFSEEQIKGIFKTALKYLEEFEADLAVESLEKIKFFGNVLKCIELIEDFEYEKAKEILNNFLMEWLKWGIF